MSESRFNIDQANLLIVRPHKSEIARFFGKIKVSAETGCWVWENAQPGKYGRFFIRGTQGCETGVQLARAGFLDFCGLVDETTFSVDGYPTRHTHATFRI